MGNLQVIFQFLHAARGNPTTPLLMIEDLEAHPYPVELDIFGVMARTALPYGHRTGPSPLNGHQRIEVGSPIFGGAVLLAFDDPWWRKVTPKTLEGACNLLIFDRFGWSRRNVLSAGPPYLVPPAIVDRWSGFGARTVDGSLQRPDEAFIALMVDSALEASGKAGAATRHALCVHLANLRHTFSLLASGERLPPPRGDLREIPREKMPPAMARQNAEALENLERLRAEATVRAGVARRAAPLFDRPDVVRLLGECSAAAR